MNNLDAMTACKICKAINTLPEDIRRAIIGNVLGYLHFEGGKKLEATITQSLADSSKRIMIVATTQENLMPALREKAIEVIAGVELVEGDSISTRELPAVGA